MANPARDSLIQMAVSTVVNALTDHYNQVETPLSWEEYWKKHLKLTGIQSVDSYIQSQVNAQVNAGISTASSAAAAVKRLLGL